MKKLLLVFCITGNIVFTSCQQNEKIPSSPKEIVSQTDLTKLLPRDEDFAAEPLLVNIRDQIESKNFNEFQKAILKNQPSEKQKVIKMILDEIKTLGFQKSLTGVYVEHSKNVTFSIVYFLFIDEEKASKAISHLEILYTELINQEFKELEDKRKIGDDQKVLYTMYQSIPIYLAFYRRGNILVLLFVPTKSVFPRVFPISSIYLPMKSDYYVYKGLPDFAKVEKPTIADLKVPTDDYYIPNTSMLREMAEERSKLWMKYFSGYLKNAEDITKEFFSFADKHLMDFALAYVDFRYTKNIVPQKFPDWHINEIEKKLGNILDVQLISNKPIQPRYDKIHYEGGVRYQYPKLGFCDLDFRISGSKSTRKARVTFTTFGRYLKIVDIKIL